MKKTLAWESLLTCSGCEISLLANGAALLDLLERFELLHFPLLMDRPHGEQTLPRTDVVLITGGCGSQEDLRTLQTLRDRCSLLVAVGTCATHGGIPALRNLWHRERVLDTIFAPDPGPEQEVPPLLDRVLALDEHVPVDVAIPGCPPRPETLLHLLEALDRDLPPRLPEKSVCDTCPAIRGSGGKKTIGRFLDNLAQEPGQEHGLTCLLEQGQLCMGPVTAAGCAHDGRPACIRARVPCRGCFGPVHRQDNQMLAMMNGLISRGVDRKDLGDRKAMLRFSGSHGLLRPQAARKER